MSITSQTIVTDKCSPVDPWKFAKDIQHSQPKGLEFRHTVLFNKGRYFETTIYNDRVRESITSLTGIQPEFGNMICGPWNILEDFVIAMNIMEIYVYIEIDYI